MNVFPQDYVLHNLPLIILSGLQDDEAESTTGDKARTLLREGGFRIKTGLPVVKSDTAQALLQALLSHDSSDKPWHGRHSTSQAEQDGVFHIRSVGRVYALPPRKAPPPAHSPRLRPSTDGANAPPSLVLHSTISPLTPSSPLYPGGVMTPLWVTKHQSRLPSIFIAFFALVSDPNTSILQDNKLKSEINNIRSVLNSANYKTRLMVVIVGEDGINISDADDRLMNLRRATTLDSKTMLYLPAGVSTIVISDFARNMLTSLYPSCIEYYRDLSKHARRKRSRNVAPQPTVQPISGTSQILSLPAWNVRYEFKLGVFAEFRQEMEAALRNYEAAYEGLLGSEVFEAIPSWSPRFNEARLLSDTLTIRIIRCFLWLGQTTNAVSWWTNHRDRIKDLLDRKSVGTETYGWAAWQSTWSKCMATLVQRAQVLLPREGSQSASHLPLLFISTEKTLPLGERYTPWESLHHEGYWLDNAQEHTKTRRTRALQMPEEDRTAPGQSPASTIASKSHLYDRYLTLEPHKEYPVDGTPGFDYVDDIIRLLDAARQHFSDRDQVRMAAVMSLRRASELVSIGSFDEATSELQPIWEDQNWRKAGWWLMLEQVGLALSKAAIGAGNLVLATQVEWEMTSPVFTQISGQLLDSGIKDESENSSGQTKLSAALDIEHSLSHLVPSFVFATAEGHVGEVMDAQISLQNMAQSSVSTLRPSQIKVVFEGGLKPIYLVDDRTEAAAENGLEDVTIVDVKLEDVQTRVAKTRRSSFGAAAAVGADVDLVLKSQQTKVFQVQVVPREAGEVSVASVTLTLNSDEREVNITTSNVFAEGGRWWERQRGRPTARPCGRRRDAACARVLPKPPKVDIEIPALRKVFYVNELIDLIVESRNHEDEAVVGSIEARLLSPGKNKATLRWHDSQDLEAQTTSDTATFVQILPRKELSDLDVDNCAEHAISISNTEDAIDHELEINLVYRLLSSPDTELTRVLSVDIPVIRPFEANFNFHSRFHEEGWPDFFKAPSPSGDTDTATGIKLEFLVSAAVCSFAMEEITIESLRLMPQKIVGGAVCETGPGVLRDSGNVPKSQAIGTSSLSIRPEETKKFGFPITIQKMVLGDRQPVAIDLSLEVRWRRQDATNTNVFVLQLSRFLVPSSEPRVLLRAQKHGDISGLYRLDYTIENPSLHFLTFNLTMDSSDDFVFSGCKATSMSLVPVSRHGVVYRILSNKTKAWIKVHLEVVDAYFGQTLKIQPAADGVRMDKQGNVLVWIE